tara:strand:- start:506 stop:817 length:312 start_codon:yes stop_codon:yes gene_type:complete
MKFIKDNTKIGSNNYIRTGIYKTNINNYNIMVIRNKRKLDFKELYLDQHKKFKKRIRSKGTYYTISLSKNNNFDNLYDIDLKTCKKIINNIINGKEYGLKNSY